jgi:hypothetical protein
VTSKTTWATTCRPIGASAEQPFSIIALKHRTPQKRATPMRPPQFKEYDDENNEMFSERDESRPDRINRPNASRRVKLRASRRNRANDAARRGIHQRRNKRFSW